MESTTLQTFSLRGMDERWIVDPQDALLIEDMTWTSNDSWKTSGGFTQLYEVSKITETYETQLDVQESVTSPEYPTMVSIHWFAQHNGARQWLVFEEQNFKFDEDTGVFIPDGTVTLKAFDGSKSKPNSDSPSSLTPTRTLIQYQRKNSDFSGVGTQLVDDRRPSDMSIRTQSQSYAGRLYLVNGIDEAIVFDGDICERAGFASRPPAPHCTPGQFEDSTTFPFALGDPTAKTKIIPEGQKEEVFYHGNLGDGDAERRGPDSRGFYTLHANLPYFGVGGASDAEIGAGKYSFILGSTKYTEPRHSDFENNVGLRFAFFAREQLDTRLCGYQYKVTYVNDRGQESEASQPSGICEVRNGRGGKKRARHGKCLIGVSIPIGPKECVARRVYRTRNVYDSNGDLFTPGDQRSFYLLTEIQDNMTTQIVDGNPDTALGELLDLRELGNFPPRTKLLAVFKNTMFAAGQELNEVRFSAPLFPESFPLDNVITIGDDDGGPITGLRATKNALVVFKTRGIYLIKGDPNSGFYAQTLNKDVGCVGPDSIAELPGLGMVFLSEKSVFLLEGALENTGSITAVVNIGIEIPNQLERINTAAAVRASGCVYQKDKEYWLSIPTIGSSKNNLCLIYHYEVGSWSIRKHFPIDCMVTSKDHRGYLFFGSNDSQNEDRTGILVYSRGYGTKGTIEEGTVSYEYALDAGEVKVNSIYETVSNDYRSVFSTFRPAYVMPYAVGFGDNQMGVNFRVNRSIDSSRASFQTSDQQDPNEKYPVYGSAVYGVDRWTSYRPIVLRYDISTTHKGPVRELSVSFAALNGNKIEIIGYDLEAKIGEQRKIKPLNKALRPSRR